MKKMWLFLGMGILGFAISVNGTIWRVNNGSGTAADFSTPTQAVASASVAEGDTLLVEGSPITYGALTVTKRLKIIGPGYFLNENLGRQASPALARFSAITFAANSEGSLVSSIFMDGTMFLNAGSITVTRCRIINLYVGYAPSSGSDSPNSVVSRNYIISRLYIQRATSNNVMISNNYLASGISASGTGSHTVRNNIIGGAAPSI